MACWLASIVSRTDREILHPFSHANLAALGPHAKYTKVGQELEFKDKSDYKGKVKLSGHG